ncbi:hypothetical protein Tco_0451038 [Tanacetum coccineum]
MHKTTEKISQIKVRLKAARNRQKRYAVKRKKPLEFSVGDYVLLKVSPWKGVIRFGKKGKLAPRFVGTFEIIKKVCPIAYRLDLPEELEVPLDEIQVDAKLNFMEEPVEILEKEFKKLKRSRIAIVNVWWNSKRGPEFMGILKAHGKFLNSLPPEWSKFVTDVKLVKDLHTTNFYQLHAYLEQQKLHANEVHLLRERNQDPLAFVANQQMTPPHFNTYQSSNNNPQLQQ